MKKCLSILLTVIIAFGTLVNFTITVNAAEYEANLIAHQKVDEIIQNYCDPNRFLDYDYDNIFEQSNKEAQLSELRSLVEEVTKDCDSEYEKISSVTKFVSENIYYDYDYYEGRNENVFIDPYEVWVNKRTVCSGYARLMKTFLNLINIPCMCVTGYNHEYNLAYDSANDRWIYLDATWCSTNVYEYGEYKQTWGYYYDKFFDMSLEEISELSNHEIYRIDNLLIDGLYYALSTSGIDWSNTQNWYFTIVGAPKDIVNINLPVTIDGIPLKQIGIHAFYGCTSLENVSLPASITTIRVGAFENCKSLETITIPDSVTNIEGNAFKGCSSLKSIIIPVGVTTLSYQLFEDCISLTNVSIPESVLTIENSAFENCKSLETITIPDSVLTIENRTFANCTSLTSLNLPESVSKIGGCAFSDCTSLKSVVIPNNSVDIDEFAFYNCPKLTIYGNWGSSVEAFAKEENIKFIDINHTHSYTSTVTQQVTCTENGMNLFTCSCGDSYKETIPATGHIEILVPAVPATCVVNGLTEGKKCSGCNAILVAQQTIPATGHITTLVGNKPATFEADGHTGNEVCTVCNQTINTGSVIPKLTLTTPTVTGVATNSGIQINWNAIENAQGYVLYKRVYDASTKKWGKWQIINANVTDVTYLDSDVTLGTSYRYTVRAKYGSALSGYTSSATIKYNVTPTVKVANASNGIKVSWSTAANATGYTVYRSTYSNGKWSGWKNMGTAKANKTAWTDKNVKSGVAYKYTVRAAYNKVLSSYNKSGISVVFLNTPTVKISNNATGIKVTWNKIPGATGYVIYSSQYDPATNSWSGWVNRGTVNTNSWIDTAVQSGVTYKYTVRAVKGKSLSAYVSSGALMYLAQPTVTIANASKGINVSWSQSAGATGYTVYRSEYDAKTKKWSSWKSRGTAAADKSSWVDKKVTSGKYYKYTVRAINGNAKSTYVATSGMIFLAQPTVTVSKDTNSNVISWNAVNGATGYRVFRKVNGETNWSIVATVKTTTCSDTNINDESTYTYTVRAYKGKVWSSYDINGVTINRNYKQTVLDLVNVERAKAGLSPLEYYYNGQLAADIRANEISQKFAHERPDGNSCFTVFEEVGISCYSAGENIAWGYHTPEAVMNAWMNSEGHRANILNPGFTHMIVGYDAETKSWVQLFLGNPYVQ